MTTEEAIEILEERWRYSRTYKYTDAEIREAFDMAIKALEQQPTDTKTYLKRREENYVEYNVEWFLKNWELELEILSGGKIKPTDADCISRKAVLDMATTIQTDDFSGNEIIEVVDVDDIKELPPITPQQKIGHWINLEKTKYKGRVLPFWSRYECSKCGSHGQGDFNYCPNCGSEMTELKTS